MACFPINGCNQTAIYLSWPSTAASWWLIHAGHGNSRKELIEEDSAESGAPAIRQPGLCLQADVTCAVTWHFLSFACLDMWDIHFNLWLIPDFQIRHIAFIASELKSAPAAPPRQTNTAWWWTGFFFFFFYFFFTFLFLENSTGNIWKTSGDSHTAFSMI